ncbi:MAG: hypothetical protein R6X34_13415, partial [Chloroflexota bacterium]
MPQPHPHRPTQIRCHRFTRQSPPQAVGPDQPHSEILIPNSPFIIHHSSFPSPSGEEAAHRPHACKKKKKRESQAVTRLTLSFSMTLNHAKHHLPRLVNPPQ